MSSRPQGPLGIFEAGEALWAHTAKAIKLLEGALSARVPLDCNGKPLGYVPQPQLGRCWFDKTPHHKNDSCFRWYVLRDDEQCRGGP